jgi:cytochrome b6-f complex iron-sulfur subunit
LPLLWYSVVFECWGEGCDNGISWRCAGRACSESGRACSESKTRTDNSMQCSWQQVVRGPAPLSLALAKRATVDGTVVLTPWTETDFRDGNPPWWKA